MSGVGNYVVQYVTINGTQRTLPTMSIFTESCESLAELERSTIEILSASVGFKYSPKDIIEKINFVMTDRTAHNLKVFDSVCQDLGTEHTHTSVTCNMHVLMMIQRKAEKVFQDIHDGLGHTKIKECFLVYLDFKNQPFIVQALKFLSSFSFLENLGTDQVTLKVSLDLKMSLFHSKTTDLIRSLTVLPLFYIILMI